MKNAAFPGGLVTLSALLSAATSFVAVSSGAQGPPVASSVVKVAVLSDLPDLANPWQTQGVEASGGSGVIIEGNRILTNAHVVESAVRVEVKRAGGSAQFPARVTHISHDADLALLQVDDNRFFEGARAIRVGNMPKLQQDVVVYGFPVGGHTLSITSGICLLYTSPSPRDS